MTFDEAIALLGVDADERDHRRVREAYLREIRASHPDRDHRPDANERSARLTVAYTVVRTALAAPTPTAAPTTARPSTPSEQPRPGAHGTTTSGGGPTVISVDVSVVADDTIEVAAPLDLTFAWLVQTGHAVGDVTFLDRSAALLQILVSFVDEPVCQMIFDLQGRAARGTTEVFCTIDSIEDRPAPPIEAVTRFVAEHLAETITGTITGTIT